MPARRSPSNAPPIAPLADEAATVTNTCRDQIVPAVESIATNVPPCPGTKVSTEQSPSTKAVTNESEELVGKNRANPIALGKADRTKKSSKRAQAESMVSEQSRSTKTIANDSNEVGGKRRADTTAKGTQPRKKSKNAIEKSTTEDSKTATAETGTKGQGSASRCHRDHSDLSSFENFEVKGFFVPGARFFEAVCLRCKKPGRPVVLNGVFKACKGYPAKCDMAWCGRVGCAQACPALQGTGEIGRAHV